MLRRKALPSEVVKAETALRIEFGKENLGITLRFMRKAELLCFHVIHATPPSCMCRKSGGEPEALMWSSGSHSLVGSHCRQC